jgi:mono/diheme cytochrome c family protein
MYRGIIQHKTYLTEYLKGEIRSRQLTEPLTCGRIYKIVPKGKQTPANVSMPTNPDTLVRLLQHPNGWIRDEAQQLIVDKKLAQVVPALRQNVKQTNNPILAAHSLWALEGLGALQAEDVTPLLNQANWKLRVQALSVLPSLINKNSYRQYLPLINQLADNNDTLTAPYLAFVTQVIKPFDSVATNNLLLKIVKQQLNNVYISDAAISTIKGKEEVFAKQVRSIIPDTSLAINKKLYAVIDDIKNPGSRNIAALKREFPKGIAIFNSVCQTCHGVDGNGIKSLAPPLHKSEWVLGDKNKLIPIVLYGLTGPVKVNGKVYKAPEINGEMPGIGNNKDYKDEDIAQVLSFIRRAWSNKADRIKAEEVAAIRQKFAGRQKVFTAEELSKLQ